MKPNVQFHVISPLQKHQEQDQQTEVDVTLRLIGLIYDSVADASCWRDFLDGLVNATHASKGMLAIRDADTEEFAAVCAVGWNDDDLRIYTDRFAAIDPWARGMARWPEGKPGADFQLCSRKEIEASASFKEFYFPRNAVHGMGGTILFTDSAHSTIHLARGTEPGPFGEGELEVLRPLLPHLKRAVLLHGRLGAMRRQLATFTEHLNRLPHPLMLTNMDRRLLYANSNANAIIDRRDGLAVENGRLTTMSRRRDTALRKAIGDLQQKGDESVCCFDVPRKSSHQPYRLMLMSIDTSKDVPLGVAVPAASVLVIDGESSADPDPFVLHNLYRFTPAETRVAAQLVKGQNAEEIAAGLGISVGTVRTHIKRILAKTGTDRQGEFISLILRTVPFRRVQMRRTANSR